LNIKEYISSGVLEAYVLGQLSEQERTVLENNLQRYPELKEELARVEETQERLLMTTAVAPPSRVKDSVLSQINEATPRADAKVVSMSSRSDFWQYAAAACVTIALVSSYLAFNYYNKWQSSQLALNDLLAQNTQIAEKYNTVNQKLNDITNELDVISNPSFARVIMKGTENSPEALASIYWNRTTSEVYLSVHQLKQLSQDQQFQLWAIVDGKPVDAGVFDNETGLIRMKNIPSAAAFAVTIERRGGSVNPTLSSMQTVGNT
jgi:anti-sigma-K factor RskA